MEFISYDKDADILEIFKPGERTDHSINIKDTLIISKNRKGNIIGLEFLDFRENLGLSEKDMAKIKT